MNPASRQQASIPRRPIVLFWLLALTNVFVGARAGLERRVIPILTEQDFGLRVGATVAGFIIAFAVASAVVYLFACAAADRWGRRGDARAQDATLVVRGGAGRLFPAIRREPRPARETNAPGGARGESKRRTARPQWR